MAIFNSKTRLVKASLTTLAQASVYTLALVGAHHLGRKQYNADARLSDYGDGVLDTCKSLLKKPKQSSNTNEPVNKAVRQITKIQPSPNWISGVADLQTNEFGVVGINEACNIIWQTSLPERVHDILIQPSSVIQNDLSQDSTSQNSPSDNESSQSSAPLSSKYFKSSVHVAVMGRRPSEYFWILDSKTGSILHTIKADIDRHFYGHACYGLDGKTLYVTENNTATFDGIIGVYDVDADYRKTGEFETHGIGPHEIAMHPDNKTLVIANGGIKTERASRDELNLDTMQPSLVYLDCHTGTVLEQVYPEHRQMSVRHLSIHENGTVAIGIQFQGERHLMVPLVLTHTRGEPTFKPLHLPKDDTKGWHRFHHYIASVAVDSQTNTLCATSPLGGCAVVFDLSTNEMIKEVDLPDCAGVSVWHSDSKTSDLKKAALLNDTAAFSSFLVSDGQGYLTEVGVDTNRLNSKISVEQVKRPFAFDNHLQSLP